MTTDDHPVPAAAAEALVDQWRSDRDAFYVVAWSLDAGYSAGQILDAILRGNWVQFVHTEDPPGGCWYVLGGKGGWGAGFVAPEYPPVDPLLELECANALEVIEEQWVTPGSTTTEPTPTTTSTPATTTTEAPLAFPRTYAGEGTYTVSWSFSPGVCIQEGQSLEVMLHPDGSATGFVHFLSPSTEGFLKHTDGSYTGGGCAGSSNEFDLELTGTYELPPPGDNQLGSVFLDLDGNRWIEGTFGRDDMSIDYLKDTFMEQFAANTGLSDPRHYGHCAFPMMELTSEG